MSGHVAQRLLTAREVADTLAVSTETVLRWHRRGEFAGVVIRLPGGAIRFRADRFERWLEERATPRRGSANHPVQGAAQRLRYLLPTTPEDEE